MKPAPFAYTKARTLKEAIALLSKHKDDARLLAGGQSLIATLNMRLSAPELLIDINGIKGLDGIAKKGKAIEIGALARHTQVERSDLIAKHAPLIALAMPHIGHAAIRNRGTFGGSIAFADPAAELPACLLALGGEIEIAGPKGKRKVKADAFFKGLFETALEPREVLTAVRIPVADKNTRVGFAELARRHGDYAMVGLGGDARAADGQRILADVRLAFFGVGATPVRAKKAEAALAGGDIDAAVAALDLDPHDDVQATAKVKKASRRRAAAPRSQTAHGGTAMSEHALDITLTVNGERVAERVDARKTLVDFLREDLVLTGSHVGCEHGVCGACTVRVDGVIVRGCLMLAVQCDGATVETIEGLSDTAEIADLQAAFEQRNALQCGYCTPGMLVAAQDLLNAQKESVPSREDIRAHLSGNYCRCTGYHAIVDAVEAVAEARAGKKP